MTQRTRISTAVYANQTPEQGPQLVRGYSKDHRPDLVQLLFGVVMSRDGVLASGEVASGNEQDMKLNGYWITQIRQQLGLNISQFLLYVADSAAVTEENLHLLRLFHIDLISRLPKRFGLAETLFAKALASEQPMDAVQRCLSDGPGLGGLDAHLPGRTATGIRPSPVCQELSRARSRRCPARVLPGESWPMLQPFIERRNDWQARRQVSIRPTESETQTKENKIGDF